MKWVRQAQILLGRAGFNPDSVIVMSEAELLSHVTHLAPPESIGKIREVDNGDSATYVNEARLRRKKK